MTALQIKQNEEYGVFSLSLTLTILAYKNRQGRGRRRFVRREFTTVNDRFANQVERRDWRFL
jgi:hypothetical protein